MQNYIVAVVSSAKAKLFILEPADFPEYEASPKLIEFEELNNSIQELHRQDFWSDTKPGRNRGTAGQAHGYDDHRGNHRVELERRFAQEIVTKLTQLITTKPLYQLLLIAEPHILGIMREVLIPELPKNLKFNELAKDLCQLKAHELYEYLAAKDLLPDQTLPENKGVRAFNL
ncbi:protein required for attachment to host cells [Leptolyngbyaceae cyanobacterium JSC-12]|nr:protein required for attachment to host cells [Leptolyngbyaceae cyanobacterium JSC-12]